MIDHSARFHIACWATLVGLLAAPHAARAITLADFSIFGVDSVVVGGGSQVHTGLVGSNTSVQLNGGSGVANDVHSGGTIKLFNSVNVGGNMFSTGETAIAATSNVAGNVDAGSFKFTGNGSHVLGTVTYGTTFTNNGSSTVGAAVNAPPTPPLLPAFPGPSGFSASGAADLKNTPGGTVVPLLAGIYGDYDLGSNNVLQLSAGDYFFDSLHMDGGGDLELDFTNGPINIFVVGNMSFGSNLTVLLTNGDASDIKTEVHGDFLVSGGGEWFGTVFAPDGLAKIGNNVQLHGALWAQDVDIEHSADIFLDGDGTTTGGTTTGVDGEEPPPVVPEPMSAALGLMAFTALAMVCRRRTPKA